MMKSKSMRRLWVTLGMFTAVLLMVLILPSFAASAETGNVPVTGISLNKTFSTLHTTQREQLVATATPTNATNNQIVWTSSDTDVVTVSQTGTVTAIDFGEATVTATAADGSGVYATCHYMVNPYMVGWVGSTNQDARRVHFQFDTGMDISLVYLHVGSRIFYVNRPSLGTAYDEIINGERIKVSVSVDANIQHYVWDVQLALTPTPVGTTEIVYLDLYNGYYMAESDALAECVFWDSFLLLDCDYAYRMYEHYISEPFGFSLDAVNCSNNEIIEDFSMYSPLTTGMILLEKRYDKIYKVYFVIVYGDVYGGDGIGDGEVDLTDALTILRVSAGNDTFDSMILYYAGDIDQDGIITSTDASEAMQLMYVHNPYSDYLLYDPPIYIYYQNSVVFC